MRPWSMRRAARSGQARPAGTRHQPARTLIVSNTSLRDPVSITPQSSIVDPILSLPERARAAGEKRLMLQELSSWATGHGCPHAPPPLSSPPSAAAASRSAAASPCRTAARAVPHRVPAHRDGAARSRARRPRPTGLTAVGRPPRARRTPQGWPRPVRCQPARRPVRSTIALLSTTTVAATALVVTALTVDGSLVVCGIAVIVAGLATPPLEPCLRTPWPDVELARRLHDAFTLEAARGARVHRRTGHGRAARSRRPDRATARRCRGHGPRSARLRGADPVTPFGDPPGAAGRGPAPAALVPAFRRLYRRCCSWVRPSACSPSASPPSPSTPATPTPAVHASSLGSGGRRPHRRSRSSCTGPDGAALAGAGGRGAFAPPAAGHRAVDPRDDGARGLAGALPGRRAGRRPVPSRSSASRPQARPAEAVGWMVTSLVVGTAFAHRSPGSDRVRQRRRGTRLCAGFPRRRRRDVARPSRSDRAS